MSNLFRKYGVDSWMLWSKEIADSYNILDFVENSGAEIVVIDDFNGILLENRDSVEQFLYKLKNVAIQKTIVFVIYNLNTPKRSNKRTILSDFLSDDYSILYIYYINRICFT